MKKDTRWISYAGVGAMGLLIVAGCTGADQTGDGQTADAPEASKMQNTVDKMQEGAKTGGQTVVNSAGKMGGAAMNSAEHAAEKMAPVMKNMDDAMMITPKVKSALLANAALKATNINVTTTDKSVALDGTVKSDAQKTLAGKITAANATGYALKNNLKVVK